MHSVCAGCFLSLLLEKYVFCLCCSWFERLLLNRAAQALTHTQASHDNQPLHGEKNTEPSHVIESVLILRFSTHHAQQLATKNMCRILLCVLVVYRDLLRCFCRTSPYSRSSRELDVLQTTAIGALHGPSDMCPAHIHPFGAPPVLPCCHNRKVESNECTNHHLHVLWLFPVRARDPCEHVLENISHFM